MQPMRGGGRVVAIKIIPLIFLSIHTITDLRYRKVSLIFCVIPAVLGIAMQVWLENTAVSSLFLSMIPGFLLVALGRLTNGSIGAGDGIVSVVTGLFIGVRGIVAVLMVSMFFSAIFSLVLICFRKAKRKDRIAFVPCLLAGYLVLILMGGIV